MPKSTCRSSGIGRSLHLLELDVSGRYTDYKSYGSDFTYHAGAQWAPVREVRFRGNYGTNFRAPNLYEQFVADQSWLLSATALDPCELSRGNQRRASTIYDNCLAELTAALGSAGRRRLHYQSAWWHRSE